MKVSIKELKVENDGSELLYIRDLGFILNCGTFSNTIKRCDDKLRKESKSDEEHGKHHAIITAAINNISGIVAQIYREPAEPPSSPDETGEERIRKTEEVRLKEQNVGVLKQTEDERKKRTTPE